MNAFKKALMLTDIHFGKKTDSLIHNQDCLKFLEWAIEQYHLHECDTIIFGGDWSDNGTKIRLDTNWYSYQGVELLTNACSNIIWIVGNHDVFYKENRSIHSLPFLERSNKIRLINEVTEIGDCLFCPYLIGDEYASVPDKKVKYVFGHFSLPLFLTNDSYEIPETGRGLHMDHFWQCEAVFSGHFHKRQVKINKNDIPVYYIGNCFPHNYNDLHDRSRGCMILEWNKEPHFLDWKEAPNYNRTTFSELLSVIENGEFEEKYTAQSVIDCRDDVGIELEQLQEIKAVLLEKIREINVLPLPKDSEVTKKVSLPEGKSVSELIRSQLSQIDTADGKYDRELLIDIFDTIGIDK